MKERFETFTTLITKINRNIRKIKNQEMAEYDLRSTHVSCLYYLYAFESLTATDLCEHCEEDKASISRALEFLKLRGYVTCASNSAKRYKSQLFLTEQGKEIGKKVYDKVDQALEAVGAGLSEEERVAFYCSLSKISENLEHLTNS